MRMFAGRTADVAAVCLPVAVRLGAARGASTGARLCADAASASACRRLDSRGGFASRGVGALGFVCARLLSDFCGSAVGTAKPTDKVALTRDFGVGGVDHDSRAMACSASESVANLTIVGVIAPFKLAT